MIGESDYVNVSDHKIVAHDLHSLSKLLTFKQLELEGLIAYSSLSDTSFYGEMLGFSLLLSFTSKLSFLICVYEVFQLLSNATLSSWDLCAFLLVVPCFQDICFSIVAMITMLCCVLFFCDLIIL